MVDHASQKDGRIKKVRATPDGAIQSRALLDKFISLVAEKLPRMEVIPTGFDAFLAFCWKTLIAKAIPIEGKLFQKRQELALATYKALFEITYPSFESAHDIMEEDPPTPGGGTRPRPDQTAEEIAAAAAAATAKEQALAAEKDREEHQRQTDPLEQQRLKERQAAEDLEKERQRLAAETEAARQHQEAESADSARLQQEKLDAEAARVRQEREHAEATRLNKEKQDADAARLRQEREQAEAARLRSEKLKADAARLRQELEQVEAARIRKEQDDAEAKAKGLELARAGIAEAERDRADRLAKAAAKQNRPKGPATPTPASRASAAPSPTSADGDEEQEPDPEAMETDEDEFFATPARLPTPAAAAREGSENPITPSNPTTSAARTLVSNGVKNISSFFSPTLKTAIPPYPPRSTPGSLRGTPKVTAGKRSRDTSPHTPMKFPLVGAEGDNPNLFQTPAGRSRAASPEDGELTETTPKAVAPTPTTSKKQQKKEKKAKK
ncbi:hypothetical protein BJ508DRAFT_336824 [Ascobolus immersus RN42]|uniref:Uncharacterized protein n=1 Tax=Ascobolus immersus RN42 TaxID=1160509 RepID=A0A3N4HM66_ASCIM|nr:hypothetical protein BJ508DRAFT_336824 [Ascobolus immersus RN42]